MGKFIITEEEKSKILGMYGRMTEQVSKPLTKGSTGSAMINPGGNRPGSFEFVVLNDLGGKYDVKITKWEFGNYGKVGDVAKLQVGPNKTGKLEINKNVLDFLLNEQNDKLTNVIKDVLEEQSQPELEKAVRECFMSSLELRDITKVPFSCIGVGIQIMGGKVPNPFDPEVGKCMTEIAKIDPTWAISKIGKVQQCLLNKGKVAY